MDPKHFHPMTGVLFHWLFVGEETEKQERVVDKVFETTEKVFSSIEIEYVWGDIRRRTVDQSMHDVLADDLGILGFCEKILLDQWF